MPDVRLSVLSSRQGLPLRVERSALNASSVEAFSSSGSRIRPPDPGGRRFVATVDFTPPPALQIEMLGDCAQRLGHAGPRWRRDSP
jgi:hypothetical protein